MRNKMPLVSVIIPTKNSDRTLDKCLNSIKNQTYKDIELIVVDNNSTDKTKEIAKKYTKLVFNKGPERSAQRNFGAKKAKGKFIYVIDADFIINPKVVEKCVAQISKRFDAIMVHNTPDETISWIARIRKFETNMYKNDLTYTAARFFNKKAFFDIGGYNESIIAGDDFDIQNKLNKMGYKTGFIDTDVIHIGEPTSFWDHMKKYYNYGKDFVNYKADNPEESKTQLRFFRHVYFKHWKSFLRHPILGVGFFFYHICKFSFGGVGYIFGKIKKLGHIK